MENPRSTEFDSVLLKKLTLGSSFQGLVETAAEFIGNPIVVSSSVLELIAASHAPDKIDNVQWQRLTSTDMDDHYAAERAASSLGIEITKKARIHEVEGVRVMGCAGFVHGDPVVYVLMFEDEKPFREDDKRLLETFARVAAFAISGHFMSDVHATHRSLITRLVRGETIPLQAIERNLFKNEKTMRFCVLVLSPPPGYDERHIPTHALSMVEGDFRDAKTAIVDGCGVVVLHKSAQKMSIPELAGMLEPIVRERGSKCGISNPFGDISTLKEHYEQAVAALELSDGYGASDEVLSFYCDKAIYGLFERSEGVFDLSQVTDPYIGFLRRYDRENNTKWLGFYAVYIFCEREVQRISEVLHIHKSTVKYRISRLKELAGSGLDVLGRAFYSELSFRVLFFLEPDLIELYEIPHDLVYASRFWSEADVG